MPSHYPSQASRQDRDINGTKSLLSRGSGSSRKGKHDRLIVKIAPIIPLPVYMCLCKVILEFLSYEVESISHAVNLVCLVICPGQEKVAAPSLSLKRPGALLLSLLEPCHAMKDRMEQSQVSSVSQLGLRRCKKAQPRSTQPRPNQQNLQDDSDS